MSITVFLAFCILGCDFLLYVLFQWIYGEKHRKHAHRVGARAEKRRAVSRKVADTPGMVQFPESVVQYRTRLLLKPPRLLRHLVKHLDRQD